MNSLSWLCVDISNGYYLDSDMHTYYFKTKRRERPIIYAKV